MATWTGTDHSDTNLTVSFPVEVIFPNLTVTARLMPGQPLVVVDKQKTYNIDEVMSTNGPIRDVNLEGVESSKAEILGRIRLAG